MPDEASASLLRSSNADQCVCRAWHAGVQLLVLTADQVDLRAFFWFCACQRQCAEFHLLERVSDQLLAPIELWRWVVAMQLLKSCPTTLADSS
jgi:hypothetical protein